MGERDKGPIELLCKEIGAPFDRRMERPEILMSFVGVLVGHVYHDRRTEEAIVHITGKTPSPISGEALDYAMDMIACRHPDDAVASAARLHDFIHANGSDEQYPCDHLVDMLGSCASAIRFGLAIPCHSRHAADAADHVWKRKYGLRLFDGHTPDWRKEWSRAQLHEAILRLALRGLAGGAA